MPGPPAASYNAAMHVLQSVVVVVVVAFWVILLAHCVDDFNRGRYSEEKFAPILVTRKNVLIAAPFVVVGGLMLTHALRSANPEPQNLPVPCGDGADYDTRDGLCYKFVPLQFQSRQGLLQAPALPSRDPAVEAINTDAAV
ncbi:MAG: hypothetical protein ABW175_02960 [Bradyrhizobium sp.]